MDLEQHSEHLRGLQLESSFSVGVFDDDFEYGLKRVLFVAARKLLLAGGP